VIFSWIKTNIFDPIAMFFVKIFSDIRDNIIEPIFNKIAAIFNWIKDKIFTPITDSFKTAFNIIKVNIFDPIVDAFRIVFNWVYDNIVKPIKDVGKGASSTANKAGDAIADVFGWAHGGIVYKAAQGLKVPGMSAADNLNRDTVPAMLSPGEIVLPNSVTQNGNLMRDLALLLTGENVSSGGTVQNLVNNNTSNQTINISVNVSGNTKMSKKDVENDILPVIIDGIKEASNRGKSIVNAKGIY
jgi:hypothetical protein